MISTELLITLTNDLAKAMTLEEVALVTVGALGRALDARSVGLWQRRDEHAHLVEAYNYTPELRQKLERVPLDAEMPMTEMLRTGEACFYDTRAEYAERYPASERTTRVSARSEALAFACLPLVVHDRTIGALVVAFFEAARFGNEERGLLRIVAGHAAHALERVRLFAAERRARDHTTRLQQLSSALAAMVSSTDVARTVVEEAMTTLNASVGALYAQVSDEAMLDCLSAKDSPFALRYPRLALTERFPAVEVARTGVPRYIESLEDLEREYPELAAGLRAVGEETYSIAVVPVGFVGRPAFLALSFRDGRPLAADERPLLEAIARHASMALQRASLFDNEARSNERNALLAEASATLASTLDYDTTLRNVVRLVVPRLADFAFFDVRDGEAVVRTPLARDPGKQVILDASRWVRSAREDVNLCALSSGAPALHPRIDEAFLADMASSPEHLAVLRRLELCAMITVPLHSRGQLIAALTLCMGESGRGYSRVDLETAQDVATRAAMALENATLFRELQRAVRVRDEFLSVASHELNTPLAALSLSVQRAKRELASPALDRAMRQVGRLARLVEQLLDVSRLQSGRLVLEPVETDLIEIVRECVARLEEQRAETGSTIVVEAPESLVGSWDPLRLEQVVTNLVSNALKYGAGSAVTVAVTEDGERVVLVVRDRGIGIAPLDIERIFGRFERAVSIKQYGGFGLGLWITREIVEASGGRISVESAPGDTRFTVSIPRRTEASRSDNR